MTIHTKDQLKTIALMAKAHCNQLKINTNSQDISKTVKESMENYHGNKHKGIHYL